MPFYPIFRTHSVLGLPAAILLVATSVSAMKVTGTVKSGKDASALPGVAISIKDSAKLTTTTDGSGGFTIQSVVGILRGESRGMTFRQSGRTLELELPVSGPATIRLFTAAGKELWSSSTDLSQGKAKVTLPATGFGNEVGFLQVAHQEGTYQRSVSWVPTSENSGRLEPASRQSATYPTIIAKKAGYQDTTFVMTAETQTGITITMRDTTKPGPTACTLPPSPNPGSGSFTNYWFGQGSYKEGDHYALACGFHGYEPSGQGSDKIDNISTPQYFFAIPGNSTSDFNTVDMCGACVEVTGSNGKKIVGTITDECPNDINAPCKANPKGHLDVSYPAFSQLGFSVGNPTGTTWKYVKCPVTGNLIVRMKPNNADQIYIENTILPIKDVMVGSNSATHLTYGAWKLTRRADGATITIVDYSDRTVKLTLPATMTADQDYNTGVQFPECQ